MIILNENRQAKKQGTAEKTKKQGHRIQKNTPKNKKNTCTKKITIFIHSDSCHSFICRSFVHSFSQSVISCHLVSFRFVRFHVISISCHAILLFSIISRHLVNPTDTDGMQRASYRSPCRYNTFLFMKLPPRLAQALHNPSYSIFLYHNPLRSTRSIIVIHNLSYLLSIDL